MKLKINRCKEYTASEDELEAMLHNIHVHIRLSNRQLYITHNTNCMQESGTRVPNKTFLSTINCQMVVSQHFIAICVLLV